MGLEQLESWTVMIILTYYIEITIFMSSIYVMLSSSWIMISITTYLQLSLFIHLPGHTRSFDV